nr:sugar phosphate isomerase/epimerase [uncultured Friedmanniella sp.]
MAGPGDLRYACQTYSWQLSLDVYAGRIEHMVRAAAAAGFTGFEPELVMLGSRWSVGELRDALAAAGLELAALVLAESWLDTDETEKERADADRVIEAAAALPGAKVVLCALPGPDRSTLDPRDVEARQIRVMARMQAVTARAGEAGVGCTFHPNSAAGSLFRTQADYSRMADLLPASIGYTPDVGHLARGGLDPLAVLRDWGDRVDHVHIKDLADDGSWAESGTGMINIPALLQHLADRGYRGWVTFEDESAAAEQDPDAAAARNGRYVASLRRDDASSAR